MTDPRKAKILNSKLLARTLNIVGTILSVLVISIALTNYLATSDWSINIYTNVRDILGFSDIKKWQIINEMKTTIPLIFLSLLACFNININIYK